MLIDHRTGILKPYVSSVSPSSERIQPTKVFHVFFLAFSSFNWLYRRISLRFKLSVISHACDNNKLSVRRSVSLGSVDVNEVIKVGGIQKAQVLW